MMMSRGVPERIRFTMIAVLCAVVFLPSALFDSNIDMPSRDDYLRSTLGDILTYVPPNDVELWFGWRRVYLGENVFSRMRSANISVRFRAPSSGLSTVVLIWNTPNWECRFQWLKVNVPGDDGIGGKELRTTWPARPVGMLIVLIFPQNVRLDENAASQTFKSLRHCDADGLQAALQLGRAYAVTVYTTAIASCGSNEFLASNEDTPNWDLLRPNLHKLSHYHLFTTPPRGVLEVEYLEGVPLRMGNCLPTFLTLSPPRSLKFAATAGTYYTLIFSDVSAKTHSCKWLLVNVPEGDFSRGLEVVPYSPYRDDVELFGECIFLLYSQGKNEMDVSEVRKASSLTPKDLSDRFSLGDPVAANFYVAYMYRAPAPERRPSASSARPPTRSPVRDRSSAPEVPSTSRGAPTWRIPSSPRVPSTAEVVTTTRKALVTRTSTGSTLTLQNCLVCVAVTGLLVLF